MYATVSGGSNNKARLAYSTVPGGEHNLADAPYSFAAGRRAKAMHEGTLVWADSTDADFSSTANDQFLIRATGGVGIGTDSPAARLDVEGTVHASGAIQSGSSLILDGPNDQLVTTSGEMYFGREPMTGDFRSVKVGIGTTSPLVSLDIDSNDYEPVHINSDQPMAGIWFTRSGGGMGMMGYGDICGGGSPDALEL